MEYYPLTYFLAKLIGFTIAIFGLSILVRMGNFQKTIKEVSTSDALMTFISIFPLVIGLSIILSHNLWIPNWPVIITMIGWFALICGLCRLFFHKALMAKMASITSKTSGFRIIAIILILVGLYLLYKGYLG